MFHIEAIASRATAAYITEFESNRNFPTKIPGVASRPSIKGPNPCRPPALNANAPRAKTREIAVTANRYLVEIRNPNPTELNSPA